MKWLAIVGIGEDGVEGISAAAQALIETADLVVGGARHLGLAASVIRGATLQWPSPMSEGLPQILTRRGTPVAVLASGDPYCYGVGATLAGLIPADETICIPAPSAFTLACARLGWAGQDVTTISFCGRPLHAIAPLLQPGRRIIALSADATTPHEVCAFLHDRGFGTSRLHVLQAMGGPRERIASTIACDGVREKIDPLNLIAIEIHADAGARIIPLAAGLPDGFFEHDGQLTKSEVRAVTLAALAPRAGKLLWDIGAGSGAIGIEWMLRHSANRAIAIDARADRAARAGRNALALGTPDLRIVIGNAPACLSDLPMPDAIFVGGGVQDAVLGTAWAMLKSGGRIVANAVTIETESLLFAAHATHGGSLTRISIDRLDGIGTMHGFRRAMSVTQWAASKP
jgi:precorrin-6Y C5,15-methyltransferase (decarboxylating)